MFPTLPPPDVTTTLDEVIARLAAHEAVDGILTMGSTGGDRLTPESDYDLFGAGHAGTSISAAYGFAVAREIRAL